MFRQTVRTTKRIPLQTHLFKATPRTQFATMSQTAQVQKNTANSKQTGTAADLGIENTNINTAPGVSLSEQQRIHIGSVLDLFAGRPSLKKLQLWADDAKFQDPLTNAEGRKQFEAQWYGLQAAFSEIERLRHEVTSGGDPIVMNLKTRYKVKWIGTEQIIESVVKIFSDGEGRITEVQDRWNGNIPDGAIAKVFRNLNSVVVPVFVGVPKNEEAKVN